jgi:hypothetical protein
MVEEAIVPEQPQNHGQASRQRAWEPPVLSVVTLRTEAESKSTADRPATAPPHPATAFVPRHAIKSISPEGFLTGWM